MSLLPDWLTGFDSANGQAAADADASLQQLNAQTYGPAYTPRDTQTYGVANQQAQIDQAFTDELAARADGIIGRTFRGIGAVLKATLLSVPVWVWLVGAAALFFYLGGGPVLTKLGRKWLKAIA